MADYNNKFVKINEIQNRECVKFLEIPAERDGCILAFLAN